MVVRLAQKVVMQNYGDFVDVILLYQWWYRLVTIANLKDVKGKGIVVPVHAVKAQVGSGMAALILTLGTKWGEWLGSRRGYFALDEDLLVFIV